MSSETLKRPDSNVTRRKALDAAQTKQTAVGAASPLSTTTIGRLSAAQSGYKGQQLIVKNKKTAMVAATNLKTKYDESCMMGCSQFVQVLNFAIERQVGTFKVANRSYYGLDVATGNVPPMTNDAEIALLAQNIIDGETQRIADGGTPMVFPTLAEMTTYLSNFNSQSTIQNTAREAYNREVTVLDKMNTTGINVDGTLLKVYDELETANNEEEAATARAICRLWGMIYTRVGSNKTITVTVLDLETDKPIPDADVSLENGRNTGISNILGVAEFNSSLMDVQDLLATHLLYDDYSQEITLVENENFVITIRMTKTV